MPLATIIAAGLALAAQSAANDGPVTVLGRPWAPFISPMGEPFRAADPADDPFVRWFRGADRNADGALTELELLADAERFFATLDQDEDGEIGPEEITAYENDVAPEVQVNSRWKRTAQGLAEARAAGGARRKDGSWRAERGIDGYQLGGLQGAARYGLLNIPQPVAAADADFNRGTSLAEFRAAARQRFQLLDTRHLGRATLAELRLALPARPKPGKAQRPAKAKEQRDQRIGRGLPGSD